MAATFAPVSARAQARAIWGASLAADRLAPGAVLMFDRAGGGHVGLYVGKDQTRYYVVGDNQYYRVSIMRLEKGRRVAQCWPTERAFMHKPTEMKAIAGISLSSNEASSSTPSIRCVP